MTTRDPRSRVPGRPDSQGAGRDPTQSLSIDPADEVAPSHPSLALGTYDANGGDDRTKVESPQARSKPPASPASIPPTVAVGIEESDNHLGSTLGNYRVVELLGRGGMGFVYRAEHVKLGREVALKLLRSDYAQRKDAVARFIQEARTVNRVRHRNIVDVPDILELPDGTTCIVMEFLRGQSLGTWARTGIDLPRALAVLVQICDGLSAAHAVGVVHRDLKPDNVIVVPTSDGAELVKLLDFGVAKLLNRDDEDVGFQTAAGSVIGTPAYMSPEQAGGMAIDARSDIYSLGAIMYELFCGQPMFRGRSFGEFVRKHLTELPVRPKQTAGGAHIDDRIEAVILHSLEKDPNRRYQHVLELRDDLLHLLGGLETHLPGLTASGQRGQPLPTAPALPAIPSVTPPPPGGYPAVPYAPFSHVAGAHHIVGLPAPPPVPTPWWVWVAGGTVMVALGVSGVIWYEGRMEGHPPPAPPAAPITSPAVQPAAPIAPPAPIITPEPLPPAPTKLIELRFDSLPSGVVYAEGRSAELCRTPCTHNIDLQDGGPRDRRTFIIRSDGYRDGTLVVDLETATRAYSITLEQLAPASPIPKPPAPRAQISKPGRARKPATAKQAETKKRPGRPDPVGDRSSPPADTLKKSGDKIDRSDTLDPFRRKSP